MQHVLRIAGKTVILLVFPSANGTANIRLNKAKLDKQERRASLTEGIPNQSIYINKINSGGLGFCF